MNYLKYGKEDEQSIQPDVTVVIPVYNKCRYIKECLDSVLHQTGVVLEVICVDDCSTDGSLEIALETSRTEPLLRVVRNEKNCGASFSRNIGISLARGHYLQFTDADDLLPQGSLATLFETVIRTHSDVARGILQTFIDGVVVPYSYMTVKETIIEEKVGTLLNLPELWVPWFHCCYIISRQLLIHEKIRYPDLIIGEDPVFLASVLTKAQQICTVPMTTYYYRPNDLRPQPKFWHVKDFIKHAQLVKAIYTGLYNRCWEKYRNIIIDDIRILLSRADVTSVEYQNLEDQIREL